MSAYDQIEIHSINRTSGVYRLRLNFDGNAKWISAGSKAKIPAQGCLMALGTFQSSRHMEDLSNALGNLKIELSDHPDLAWNDGADQTGNVIRECFESARSNNYLVEAILARYSNDATPVFQEFVFAGSFDPREMTVQHRFKPKSGRRNETLSFEFTPAKRLDVSLKNIDWQQSDMESTSRPFWLCITCEPGYEFSGFSQMNPSDMSNVVTGASAKNFTADIGYGIDPLSQNANIDKLKDHAGITPFPLGNWAIKLSTVIDKLFDACNIQWDGTIPDVSILNFRQAQYDHLANLYVDEGLLGSNDLYLNWNYAFGFNPYENSNFKGPATFDVSLQCRDFLKSIAGQLKSRIDIYDYTSEGLPIARFVAFGETTGTLPVLEELGESSEDALITDKDGVEITRRGFEGSVIAPANATNPVAIEIPFAPYAIGYESGSPFDKSRLTPNQKLDFIDQWKVAFRSGNFINDSGVTLPLNPDGWGVGAHIFYYTPVTTISLFPPSHDTPPGNIVAGIETVYTNDWSGYYPVHAIYEKDRGSLSDEEIRERQQNFLISYALYFGRYLRGERRQLQIQFKGCVAPMWKDIATGQTYNFKPLTDNVEYVVIDIERDVDSDIVTIKLEESSPSEIPITFRITGSGGSSGTLDGQGGSTPSVDYDNSDNLIKHPKTDDRDNIILGQDSIGGGVVAYSAQTKNLWQYLSSALTILSGISSIGTFFSKIQNAFRLYPYGAGAGETGELQFMELSGTDYVGFKAPDSITAPVVWVLPDADGTSGQLLGTDALGNLGWYTASGTGTVTSVGLTMPGIFSVASSPVTGSGTIVVTFTSESANLVFASPNGSSGTPTFRALVGADIDSGVILTQPFQTGSIIPPGDTVFQSNTIQPTATNVYPLIIEAFDTSVNIFTVQDSTEQALFSILGTGETSVSLQLQVIPYETGFVPVVIQGFDTASNLIEVRKDDTALKFHITGSGAGDFASTLDVHGVVTAYAGVAFLGHSAIGLDTGASIDIGSAKQILASGGIGAYDYWADVIDTFPSELANLVFASPDGAPGVPTFRALVSADLPALDLSSAVILNPLTDARNLLEPSTDRTGLQLSAKHLTTKNLVEVYDPASSLKLIIDLSGNLISSKVIATTGFLSAGNSSPGIRLATQESVSGTSHFRETNVGSVANADNFFHRASTTNAAPTVLQSWTTSGDTISMIKGHVIARQTNNAGGNQGKGMGSEFVCYVQNIGGAAVIINGPVGTATTFSNIPGVNGFFAVAGNVVSLQVQGGVGLNIDWVAKDFFMSFV